MEDVDLFDQTQSLLKRIGAQQIGRGPSGSLWRVQTDQSERPIAVPTRIAPGSLEFQSVLRVLAEILETDHASLVRALQNEFNDVLEYPIPDAHINGGTVSLVSAKKLISLAQRQVRIAATTAQRPRARINGSFSKIGDRIADSARLAHTYHGSFVIPVTVPVSKPEEAQDTSGLFHASEVESAERVVTRTLATALGAVQAIANRSPSRITPDHMKFLVQSGASTELVATVKEIARDREISGFRMRVKWAPGRQVPTSVPTDVSLLESSVSLLEEVEARLKESSPDPDETIAGQIVSLRRYTEDGAGGEIAIRTIRGNRAVDIKLEVTSAELDRSFDWAKKREIIHAGGRITQLPNRSYALARTGELAPLRGMFEQADGAANQ